jgi:hypothetical protein
MFRSFLALFLVAYLAPSLAFAQSAGTPCDFVDQEVLNALKLGHHSMKVVNSKVAGTNGAQAKNLDTCTFTPPQNAPSPSLSVTSAEMPSGLQALKPSCSEKLVGELEFAICTGTVRNSLVTFVLLGERSHVGWAKKAFPIQIERLLKRLAGPGSQGAPTN